MARRVVWAVWICNCAIADGSAARSDFVALGGESPLHSRHGQVLAEGNGFSGDRESEGSRKQSAGATNRKRIEAAPWGQQAIKC